MTACIYCYDGASFSSIYFRIKVLGVSLLSGRAVRHLCLYLLYCLKSRFSMLAPKQVMWFRQFGLHIISHSEVKHRGPLWSCTKKHSEKLWRQMLVHKTSSIKLCPSWLLWAEGNSLMNYKQILSARTIESFPCLEKTSKIINTTFDQIPPCPLTHTGFLPHSSWRSGVDKGLILLAQQKWVPLIVWS